MTTGSTEAGGGDDSGNGEMGRMRASSLSYAGTQTGRTTYVGWPEVVAGSIHIATYVNTKLPGDELKGLLVVTRGGLVPAGIVAQHLETRKIVTVCLESYSDEKEHKGLRVVPIPGNPLPTLQTGKGWVCIDDIVDTGKTMEWVKSVCPDIITVSLYAKHKTLEYPDMAYKLAHNQVWVHFPWEP